MEKLRYESVFEKHMKEFEPIEIGEADPRQKMKIENQYDELCSLLNKVIAELSDFLKLVELPKEKIFEFIKNDPDKWLPKQYIECNNVEIPGSFDIEKVIETGMVPIPSTDELLSLHSAIMKIWKNINSEGFIYPLHNLTDEEDQIHQFSISIEIFEAVDQYLAVKTTTAKQNVIVTVLNNLLESLYDLSALRVIKLEKGPAELDRINNFLLFKGGGVTLNPRIFKRHPALKQYFERPTRNNHSVTLDELLQ